MASNSNAGSGAGGGGQSAIQILNSVRVIPPNDDPKWPYRRIILILEQKSVADSAAAADAEGPVTPVPTEMELVLAELHHARDLTPRSKRLLAALVETASAELDHNPTAATLRINRAAFWRKVRVGILAATVFSVAAMDVALAVALYGARRGNHHLLPAT